MAITAHSCPYFPTFHTAAVTAVRHPNPKLHLYRLRSLMGCIIEQISRSLSCPLSPPFTPPPPPRPASLLSSRLSGVLWCSLIRASGIGCHYLSAVFWAQRSTVSAEGKPCPACGATLPACTSPSGWLGHCCSGMRVGGGVYSKGGGQTVCLQRSIYF